MKISAAVLTKNEEKNIARCLESLLWCDEIILIDDNSTDNTVKIAKNFKATIFKRNLESNFSQQRNFALEKVKGNWILFADADEVVTPKLAQEIKKKVENTQTQGFYIKRKDFWQGKTINFGEVGSISILRLARRGAGKWKREVHEYWDVVGKKETLGSPLMHYPHQSLKEFLADINTYSTLHAQANKNEGKYPSMFKIVFYPLFKFLNGFILKLGFLDGTHGFVLAIFMSLHSFLSWSKLWLLKR